MAIKDLTIQKADSEQPTQAEATLAAWEYGDITDLEALRALTMQLGEVEDDYQTLGKEREYLRETIGRIVARLPGQRTEVAGFGALAITGGGETISWDTKALDALLAGLVATGDAELVRIAGQIAQARKTSQRATSLRITREKTR